MDDTERRALVGRLRTECPGLVEACREAEAEARSRLDLSAGAMGARDLRELLALAKADGAGHRLPGSFEGAGIKAVVGRPGIANRWIGRLWHQHAEVARETAAVLLGDPEAPGLPTSDPALPTFLLYLRDPAHSVPCNVALLRGAVALGATTGADPPRSLDEYDAWCAAVRRLGEHLGLADAEHDGLLALADPGPPRRARVAAKAPSDSRRRSPRGSTRPPAKRAARMPEREERLCTVCFTRRPLAQFEGDGTVCADCR